MLKSNNKKTKNYKLKKILHSWQLYTLALPSIIWIALFCYGPMYGALIAFKDYAPSRTIWESDWVGLLYFERFFKSPYFLQVLVNTLKISFATLLFTIPIPIFLALLLNGFRMKRYKRFVQTVIYAPNFISIVTIVGMMTLFLSPHTGIINRLIVMAGGTAINFMGEKSWFVPLFVISEIWQKAGFSAVVYLAALAGVSPTLHEAASIDGCNRWQRIRYIDLPAITPTIVTMTILAIGGLMNVGGDKVYLMKNDVNANVARTIFVHVTDMGIGRGQWSYASAVGLFNSVVNMALLFVANKVSNKITKSGLF